MKGKRCYISIETKESKALKAMREFRGVSVRKLSEKLQMSHSAVHQLESGRANIQDEYIQKFLAALGFTRSDLNLFLSEKHEFDELKQKCLCLVHEMEPAHFKKIYQLLQDFKKVGGGLALVCLILIK